MQSGRRVGTAVAALAIVLTLGPGAARAETTGDLYVASAGGILEVITASASVLDSVPVTPPLGSIAIRPDGRELYALAGGRAIVRLDLESMAVTGRVALPATATALAYPRGEQLVAALPSLRELDILDSSTGQLSRIDALPGAANMLAADRRDPRVVAAARGARWVAIIDPGTGSVRSTTINGSVSAVAFDGTAGIVVVATTAPNRVVGLNLHDFSTAWSMSLAAAPMAVAVASDRTLVAAGSELVAMENAAAPGWPFAGAPASDMAPRHWAALARPATALTMSDDGTYLYAMEADRVEGFLAARSAATESSAPGATRTVRLAGSHAPVGVVAVPGAKPILGGPASAPDSTTPVAIGPATSGTTTGPASNPATGAVSSPASRPARTQGSPPRTDTVIDGVEGWVGSRPVLPGALLVALVILVLGLGAIRWYERRGEA